MNKVKQTQTNSTQLSQIPIKICHDWEINKFSTAEVGTNGCSWGSVEVKIWDEICFQFVVQVKKICRGLDKDSANKLGNIVYCH